MAATIAMTRHRLKYKGEPGKDGLLAAELEPRGIHIAAIQEHRWTSAGTQQIGPYRCLQTACNYRPEYTGGVALLIHKSVLSPGAQIIQKEWSPRILAARLTIRGTWYTIMSTYAPLRRRGRSFAKDKAVERWRTAFWTDLDKAIAATPKRDILIVMGDFNSHVGRPTHPGDKSAVTGPHGYGKTNPGGHELTHFCATAELRVMGTYFAHRRNLTTTWQHPIFKTHFTQDPELMRPRDPRICLAVRAVPSADLATDHKLVIARMRPPKRWERWLNAAHGERTPHIDIGRLKEEKMAKKYDSALEAKAMTLPPDASWEMVRDTIIQVGKETLGEQQKPRRQLWQRDHQTELRNIQAARRKAKTRTARKAANKSAKKQIRKLADHWWKKRLAEMERCTTRPREAWGALKDLGIFLTPTGRLAQNQVITDEHDAPITDQALVDQTWVDHFHQPLNTTTTPTASALAAHLARQPGVPPVVIDDSPPGEDEVAAAVRRLKHWKAPGSDGMPAELLRGKGATVMLQRLIAQSWATGTIPNQWRDGTLVPIPKKGDRHKVQNWRGICLLAVAGKVLAHVLRERLQPLQEAIAAEYQSGFRRERGCIDAIHTWRYLSELTSRHPASTLHTVFVDLAKAYDSVPRDALWAVLSSYGTPPHVLQLTQALHDGMQASIKLGGRLLPSFAIKNGVRQGCVMAPLLFNIFYAAVLHDWESQLPSRSGVMIRYNVDGKLCRQHTNTRQEVHQQRERQIRALVYADDTALVSETWRDAKQQWETYTATMHAWGLTVNVPKTKLLTVGPNDGAGEAMLLDASEVERVAEFTYLGSKVTVKATAAADIQSRMAMAAITFGKLRQQLWYAPLSRRTKILFYKMAIVTVLLYGAEVWTLHHTHTARLRVFHHSCIRKILQLPWAKTYADIPSNITIRKMANAQEIFEIIHRRCARWMGHVARMAVDRLPKQITFGWLPNQPPLPRKTLHRHVHHTTLALRSLGISPQTWYDEAQDRTHWHTITQRGMWRSNNARSPGTHPAGRPSSNPTSRGKARNESGQGSTLSVTCPYPGCTTVYHGPQAHASAAKHYTATHRSRDEGTTTGTQLYICQEKDCTYATRHQPHFKQHMVAHRTPLACRFCQRQMPTTAHRSRHENRWCRSNPASTAGSELEARGVTADLLLHQCERCRDVQSSRTQLDNHMLRCEGTPNPRRHSAPANRSTVREPRRKFSVAHPPQAPPPKWQEGPLLPTRPPRTAAPNKTAQPSPGRGHGRVSSATDGPAAQRPPPASRLEEDIARLAADVQL